MPKPKASPSPRPSPKPKPRPKPDPRLGPIHLPSDAAALELGYSFDPVAADHVCDFIEAFCCHSTGRFAGQPFLLEPWQRDFLRSLYGWKRPDGTRRFREAYLEVPKKNGKSTLLAAMALYGLFEEPGAEVYPGAVDRAQAGIIFNECAKMVRASPALSKHLEIVESKKRIVFAARNAFLSAMSADVPNKDGLNSSLTILDELHRFASPALYDVMKYAGAARAEPILAIITTAGHDRKSICYELHERALAAIAGTAEGGDIEFLAVVYAAGEGDDHDDPATWAKANPSMGQVLKEDDFAKAHKEAKLLPRLWAAFLRLRLNVWTEQVTRWIPLDRWDALAEDASTWDLGKAKCYAALDLSSTTDLTSLSLFFPGKAGEKARTLTYFFIPKETAEARARADKVPYLEWIRKGHMIPTEGDATDHDAIRLRLGELAGRHKIVQVGIDPWNAQQLAAQLAQDGFDVVFIRQGFGSLSGPSKAFERLVLAGELAHDGNPCLRWCVANVAVEQDAAGNIKPSKRRSPERIDGVVSTVMATGLASIDKPKPKAWATFF
jgi:phage terminase large subunit-like protein